MDIVLEGILHIQTPQHLPGTGFQPHPLGHSILQVTVLQVKFFHLTLLIEGEAELVIPRRQSGGARVRDGQRCIGGFVYTAAHGHIGDDQTGQVGQRQAAFQQGIGQNAPHLFGIVGVQSLHESGTVAAFGFEIVPGHKIAVIDMGRLRRGWQRQHLVVQPGAGVRRRSGCRRGAGGRCHRRRRGRRGQRRRLGGGQRTAGGQRRQQQSRDCQGQFSHHGVLPFIEDCAAAPYSPHTHPARWPQNPRYTRGRPPRRGGRCSPAERGFCPPGRRRRCASCCADWRGPSR